MTTYLHTRFAFRILALPCLLAALASSCSSSDDDDDGGGGSSTADLADLVLSAGSLVPAFHPATTSYTVASNVSPAETLVTATTSDANATLEIEGAPATSGVPFGPIALALGPNTIDVVVTAPGGTPTKTYTVVVTLTSPSVSESEPNDDTTTANVIALGTPVAGDATTAGDVDYFKIDLTGGSIIEVELFATRADQPTWDANANIPRLTIYDTDANANAELQQHDFSGNKSSGYPAAPGGFHDLDIPMWKVPATGSYYVAITQDDPSLAGGEYVVLVHTLTVNGLQEEVEASGTDGGNDTAITAEAIVPGTVHGDHLAAGIDYYQFTVPADTTVRLEMVAFRNGTNRGDTEYFDTFLTLYDTDGTTELTSNDDAYIYDSSIEFRIDTAGTYFVAVDEFNPVNSEYFLEFSATTDAGTAETEPNDDTATANTIAYGDVVTGDMDDLEIDYFQFTGTAGDMVRLQYFDLGNQQGASDDMVVTLLDSTGLTALTTGGEFQMQTQTTILQTTGTYYVQVEPFALALPTTYVLELSLFKSSAYETEANDDIATADTLGTASAGVIDPAGDLDVFSLTLNAGELAHIVCYASSDPTNSDGDFEHSGHGSSCSPLLEVLDSTGAVVATSTSVPSDVFTEALTDLLPTCAVAGVPDTGGTYYIRVSDAAAGGGPEFYYVIERR